MTISSKAEFISGIDEAGRGAVLGPLIIAGISIQKEDMHYLYEIGIKDSKLLSRQKREKLERKIREVAKKIIIKKIEPQQIDNALFTGKSLNKLELEYFGKIIMELRPKIVYVDAPDVNLKHVSDVLKTYTEKTTRIISEHKADQKYLIVSAASIIAKVYRDNQIDLLKKEWGEIGAGYPASKKTIEFIKNYYKMHKKFPEIVRKSWKTIEKIKLLDYSEEI